MRVMHERCCGMDVHKKTMVACVMTPESQETRKFSTMTQDLLALADLVGAVAGDPHCYGEHWCLLDTFLPAYGGLEEAFTVLVVNARHIKLVPGRKTDVKDAEWIADLLRHGLIHGSFIPERPQRELRWTPSSGQR